MKTLQSPLLSTPLAPLLPLGGNLSGNLYERQSLELSLRNKPNGRVRAVNLFPLLSHLFLKELEFSGASFASLSRTDERDTPIISQKVAQKLKPLTPHS
jgi:hypothetical protein